MIHLPLFSTYMYIVYIHVLKKKNPYYTCIIMRIHVCTFYVHVAFFLLPVVPGQPSITVSSTTVTTISLSWSVPSGSLVTSYEVMWTSEECPDDIDKGSATITDGSTSYTIESLREGSSYTITVTATNSAGTGPSDSETAETEEGSERL